jgi:hypothetical protein
MERDIYGQLESIVRVSRRALPSSSELGTMRPIRHVLLYRNPGTPSPARS